MGMCYANCFSIPITLFGGHLCVTLRDDPQYNLCLKNALSLTFDIKHSLFLYIDVLCNWDKDTLHAGLTSLYYYWIVASRRSFHFSFFFLSFNSFGMGSWYGNWYWVNWFQTKTRIISTLRFTKFVWIQWQLYVLVWQFIVTIFEQTFVFRLNFITYNL